MADRLKVEKVVPPDVLKSVEDDIDKEAQLYYQALLKELSSVEGDFSEEDLKNLK